MVDQDGNKITSGCKAIVNLQEKCIGVEIDSVSEGGVTLQVDRKTGQQVVSPASITVKFTIHAVPGQPFPCWLRVGQVKADA